MPDRTAKWDGAAQDSNENGNTDGGVPEVTYGLSETSGIRAAWQRGPQFDG